MMRRPTGGVAIALLVFFLKLNPHKRKSFRDHMSDFDFIGLFLMIGGVVCLLLGLNNGTTSCTFRFISWRIVTDWFVQGLLRRRFRSSPSVP
jgi:hypothetical protein